MEDNFTRELWNMAAKSPELRANLIRSQGEELGLYSMPTKELVDYIYSLNDDHSVKEDYLYFSEIAKKMPVEAVNDIISMLRENLLEREAEGEKLKGFDLILRDVDFLAFATMALVWMEYSDLLPALLDEEATT